MISDTIKPFTSQKWVGETFSYWCKNSMLFKISDELGIKYKTAECVSFGSMKPWWQISTEGEDCKKGLKENINPPLDIPSKCYQSTLEIFFQLPEFLCKYFSLPYIKD